MLQRAAESRRWLVRQQSSTVVPELGVPEFLTLCFEQIAVAGAAMNCFQAVGSSDGGDAPLLLPAITHVVPQAVMVIFFFSLAVVWGAPLLRWMLRTAHLDCGEMRRITVRRRFLAPVTAVLKLFFLNYVMMRLNGEPGLEWKQQTSALFAALILVICEFVDVFAVAHTWATMRVRGEVIVDWREEEEGERARVTAKWLIVTFFDRWKDCGMVTSFLNESELSLLLTEVPSMAWASWTCCQRGTTPDRVSYQLHRCLTVFTIVMGMFVIQISPAVDDDIAGATVFLIADVVLTSLKMYEGRHQRRKRRQTEVNRRRTMITPVAEDNDDLSSSSHSHDRESSEGRASKGDDRRENTEVLVTPHPRQPQRTNSLITQCLELKRLEAWKAAVMHNVPTSEWVFALLDCVYSVLVVFNFYETVQGAELQVMPGLLDELESSNSSLSGGGESLSEEELMDAVNRVSIIISTSFWVILSLSLAGRWYFLYSFRRFGVPRDDPDTTSGASIKRAAPPPHYFSAGVQVVKLLLLPMSIGTCTLIMLPGHKFTPKQGVNVMVAGTIGAIAAARTVDAFGRALHGLGRTAEDPPGVQADSKSTYVRASSALQVFWDRFNDFLGPLSLVHLVVFDTDASKNFIVVYFLMCVCALHALIAFVDSLDTKSGMYLTERLGYLVAVILIVSVSKKYVARSGVDLYAPVQLVTIEFLYQIVALCSRWKAHRFEERAKKQAEPAGRAGPSTPMLSSLSESSPPVLSPVTTQDEASQSMGEQQREATTPSASSPSSSSSYRQMDGVAPTCRLSYTI